jgi:hypothetical protein
MDGKLERVLKNRNKTEDDNKIETHDPTTASVLPRVKHELKITDIRAPGVVLGDRIDRKFHMIRSLPEDQLFLARMLKGIMPVSDITYDKHGFYSYEMPLERIDSESKPYTWEQGLADTLILDAVFHDDDHEISGKGPDWSFTNGERRGDAAVFFDFENFGRRFWKPSRISELWTRRLFKDSPEARTACLDRLKDLRETFEGRAGLEYLKTILGNVRRARKETPRVIAKAPGSTEPERLKTFQEELLDRIDSFEKLLLSQ